MRLNLNNIKRELSKTFLIIAAVTVADEYVN